MATSSENDRGGNGYGGRYYADLNGEDPDKHLAKGVKSRATPSNQRSLTLSKAGENVRRSPLLSKIARRSTVGTSK